MNASNEAFFDCRLTILMKVFSDVFLINEVATEAMILHMSLSLSTLFVATQLEEENFLLSYSLVIERDFRRPEDI